MQESEPGIAAWLICEDIFNKIKTELITQAMDTLQEAIDSKAIEVSGSLVNLPDKPSDTEMSMFIINRLIEQREKIIERYKGFMSEDLGNDPKKIAQKERLEKFLLAVDQISALMHYSEIVESWMHDVAMEIATKEPSEVIKKTIKGDESRIEVLNYVLKNKKMEKELVLTENERRIIESVRA